MQPDDADDNLYLQQEILSSSPLRLRWMLIQRAEELCGYVQQLWKVGEHLQAAGWLLRVREILGELLNGVSDPANPVSQQVADFYVFLLQLLTRIEQTSDPKQLKTLEELLHLENETWQMVVQKSLLENLPGGATSTQAIFPDVTASSPDGTNDYSGGLSLEV
jgi:flagellar secretion chaperone FliS